MTKKRLLLAVLFGAAMSVTAQDVVVVDGVPVDQSRMPGWTPRGTPDYSLMTPWGGGSLKEDVVLPDHLNNVNSIYFPPRFNQSGGSCGPASRIGYMLTHELNAYRGTDASLDENRLPPNFVYPFSYDGSSKDVMAINNGVPNMVVYGGFPYSSIYGFAESDAHDAGWMTGYEKWYHAMFNRLGTASNFPTSTATTDGAIAVKRWLLNHNGDESFMVGGVLGLGCSAGSMVTKSIASTEANRAAGVVGKAYVDHFGTTVDHAVTLVGWDDRVEFASTRMAYTVRSATRWVRTSVVRGSSSTLGAQAGVLMAKPTCLMLRTSPPISLKRSTATPYTLVVRVGGLKSIVYVRTMCLSAPSRLA